MPSPSRAESGAQLFVRLADRCVQDDLAQRPGVLRVGVDGPRAQRLRDDLRPPEVDPVLCRGA